MMRRLVFRASSRAHAALLYAYPRAFRARFGADMQAVFESRIDAALDRGAIAAAVFLVFTLADVVGGGLLERFAPNPQLTSARSSVMTWDAIRHDIRISFRTMRRAPLFTALAVTALALGIGATAAIFAIVDGVLLRPLPYRDPGSLVMLWSNNTHLTTAGADRNPVSPANFLDFKNLSHSFSDAQAMYSFLTTASFTDGGVTEIVQGAAVSNGMFAMLGRGALIGRTFEGNDQSAALLSYPFWMRRYGGDRSVVGRTVTGDGAPMQIIGVMPPDFVFPYKTMLGSSGFTTAKTADIWTPIPWGNARLLNAQGTAVRSVHFFAGVARLKPGVTAADAQRDLTHVAAELALAYPQTNEGWKATVVPLAEQTVGGMRPALLLLFAGAAFVLLIVCANVANLVLSRSLARQREFAVRAALGASGRQLARQSLVESFCLAAVSGAASAIVFVVSLNLLRSMAPADTPRIDEVAARPAVFVFIALVTLLTGALVALLPALASARSDPQGALKDGGRGTTAGRRGRRVRSALVVAELALAVMLTAGAGLLLRSFVAVMQVDPGCASDHLLTLKINAPARAQHGLVPFYDQLFAKIESIPGVISVGGTTRMPLGSTEVSTRLEIEGVPRAAAELPEVEMRRAIHNYFPAMSIPLLQGRAFTTEDTATSPRVAIVNETLARRLFPDGNVVGCRVRMGPAAPETPWTTIVGVFGDVHHTTLEQAPKPEYYISGRQGPPVAPMLAIRTSGDPARMAETIRRELRAFDATMPVFDVQTMESIRSTSVSQRRFLMTLVLFFGGLAVGLAAVGVYGVMALAVAERTAEVGVRIALGANATDILGLVLGQASRLSVIGVAIGLAGALAMAPLFASQLFGVAPFDPVTFSAVPLVLMAVAIAATLGPARRAMRVDPTSMLRGE
jgi:putative ABC transport system permease protein